MMMMMMQSHLDLIVAFINISIAFVCSHMGSKQLGVFNNTSEIFINSA